MKRFSLRSIFFTVAAVALLSALVVLQFQNAALVREVKLHRTELGHLILIDPSQVNLVEVPTQDQYVWRWRVFAPEGICFDAGAIARDIPKSGAPEPSCMGIEIPSVGNGVLVTASVANGLDGEYVLTLDFGGGNQYREPIALPRDEWLDGSATSSTAGRGGPQVCPYDVPIILHRRRLLEQTSSTTRREPAGDSRGMMVWITPRKKR